MVLSRFSWPRTRTVRITIVLERIDKKFAFKRATNNGISSNHNDDEVNCTWVAALLHDQIEASMDGKPSREDCASYCDEDNKIATAKIKINDLIAETINSIFVEHTLVNFETQIKEIRDDVLQIGTSAASNKIHSSSVRF